MTEKEFENESQYRLTMYHARKLLEKGAITRAEYNAFAEKMRKKYKSAHPGRSRNEE